MRIVWELLKDTFSRWQEDEAARLAAALSFYTIFSLSPLLILVIAVVSLVWDPAAVESQILVQIEDLVGEQGADFIAGMFERRDSTGSGVLGTIVGLVTLLLGATGALTQLKAAMNRVWNVTETPLEGIRAVIRSRLLSFGMVLAMGFLLLVSLVLNAGLSALGGVLEGVLPGSVALLWVLNTGLSLAVTSLLFATIFKVLPDADIAWRDVVIGAVATAILFTVGKFLLGLYLGRSGVASAYGAAGALVLILLWIYYSAQILFLGAEFTEVYARRYGSRITAVAASEEVEGLTMD
jgi:membrane protein